MREATSASKSRRIQLCGSSVQCYSVGTVVQQNSSNIFSAHEKQPVCTGVEWYMGRVVHTIYTGIHRGRVVR